MGFVVWIGVAFTIAGLGGLLYCIAGAAGARRAGLKGPEMHARLRTLMTANLAALALSGLGLTMVVVGVMLT